MSLNIDKQTKEIQVYKVNGQEFTDKQSAEEYVEKLRRLEARKFYMVRTNPDVNEGRGFSNMDVISVSSSSDEVTVFHYLVNKYGSPIIAPGGYPMENYSLSDPIVYSKGEANEALEFLNRMDNSGKTIVHLNAFGEPMELY